jgi:hypothetical protein
MSSRENTVPLYLLSDEGYLHELLSEARASMGAELLSAAAVAFARFSERLDRHLRLQSHALFPRSHQREAWTTLCATRRRLQSAVASAAAARVDGRAFTKSLDRVEALFSHYIRQERRILAPVTFPSTPPHGARLRL